MKEDQTDNSGYSAQANCGPKRSCLTEALAYQKRGWSVIPIKEGTKKPGVSWARYQDEPANERQLAQWFDREHGGRFADLGIVLGKVSGRLAVRDFDVLESYEDWAREHPELARVLPTVSTPRGAHVYFRIPPHLKVSKTETYVDGELRSNGAYVVAAPSYHPDGVQYQWLVHPPADEIPEIDPAALGLIGTSKAKARSRAKATQSNLSSRTRRFLADGALKGARNDELFAAACDMAGNKWEEDDAAAMLLVVARRSGLTGAEAETTIASAFRKARTPARPQPAVSSLDTHSSGNRIQLVEYVSNRDHVNELFDRVIETLTPANRFFNLNGQLVFVRSGWGPIRVTEGNLNGLISTFLEIAVHRECNRGTLLQRHSLLPSELVGPFTTSPRVVSKFPVLRQYTTSPVFDLSWSFIASPGFHPSAGIYYDGPTIAPVDGLGRMDEMLSDFCWREPVDKVNYIGMLLTALTMPHWITGHPLMVFNGNKPGVGKSLLAKIHAIIVDGRLPKTVSFNPDDVEFEKQLATRVEEGDRVIVIDNAKGTRHTRFVESSVLERAVTDPIVNFRRLGHNSSITRENDITFCVTMNYTRLGRDLRRRNVPINLEQSLNVRDVKFPIKRMEHFVQEHRIRLLGELAGAILRARSSGTQQIENPARHSVNQLWAATVDLLLRQIGLLGFLTNFDESEHAYDPDYGIVVEICERFHDQHAASASEWANRLGTNILEPRFTDRDGQRRTERAQATIVGSLFNQYLDATIETSGGPFILVCERRGSAHAPAFYGFVPAPDRERVNP